MQTIVTLKAQPTIKAEPIEDCQIIMQTESPTGFSLEDQDRLFQLEAERICKALYAHLPGGCFDQLLAAMLLRKASHFRVSHLS